MEQCSTFICATNIFAHLLFSGTVLGAGDTAVDKNKIPALLELTFVGETDDKQDK